MPLLLALALAAQAPAADDAAAEAEVKLAQDCSAHRFETLINVTRGGKPAQSKVRLCGTVGQSDADWIRTLKDAVAKTAANPEMPASAKQQIVSAINLEIVRLGATPTIAVPPGVSPARPAGNAGTLALPSPRRSAGAPEPVYSALPPLPPPVTDAPAASVALGSTGASAGVAPLAPSTFVPPLPRPRLSLSCFSAGDIAVDGPCFGFERDTRITVRAGEPLKDTLLRFVRDGEERGEFVLPALTRGRSAVFQLPREVCAHAVGGKLTIQIVRGPAGKPQLAQVVGTEGPFNLRC